MWWRKRKLNKKNKAKTSEVRKGNSSDADSDCDCDSSRLDKIESCSCPLSSQTIGSNTIPRESSYAHASVEAVSSPATVFNSIDSGGHSTGAPIDTNTLITELAPQPTAAEAPVAAVSEEAPAAHVKPKKTLMRIIPNFFIAFRLNTLLFQQRVLQIQQAVLERSPQLSNCMTPPEKLHFTGFVMRLSTDTEIDRAVDAMRSCEVAIDNLVGEFIRQQQLVEPIRINFGRLGTFGRNVLFAEPLQCEVGGASSDASMVLLQRIVDHISSVFLDERFDLQHCVRYKDADSVARHAANIQQQQHLLRRTASIEANGQPCAVNGPSIIASAPAAAEPLLSTPKAAETELSSAAVPVTSSGKPHSTATNRRSTGSDATALADRISTEVAKADDAVANKRTSDSRRRKLRKRSRQKETRTSIRDMDIAKEAHDNMMKAPGASQSPLDHSIDLSMSALPSLAVSQQMPPEATFAPQSTPTAATAPQPPAATVATAVDTLPVAWKPHATIAKTSADRKNGRRLGIRQADYEGLDELLNDLSVPVLAVELLSMQELEEGTGYYRSYFSIPICNSHCSSASADAIKDGL